MVCYFQFSCVNCHSGYCMRNMLAPQKVWFSPWVLSVIRKEDHGKHNSLEENTTILQHHRSISKKDLSPCVSESTPTDFMIMSYHSYVITYVITNCLYYVIYHVSIISSRMSISVTYVIAFDWDTNDLCINSPTKMSFCLMINSSLTSRIKGRRDIQDQIIFASVLAGLDIHFFDYTLYLPEYRSG